MLAELARSAEMRTGLDTPPWVTERLVPKIAMLVVALSASGEGSRRGREVAIALTSERHLMSWQVHYGKAMG